MGVLDRIRRRLAGEQPPAPRRPAAATPVAPTPAEEARLWSVLRENPNDVQSFHALAEIVCAHAEEGHQGGDPQGRTTQSGPSPRSSHTRRGPGTH